MGKSARKIAEQIADELDEMPLHFRVDKIETIIAAAIREDRAEPVSEEGRLLREGISDALSTLEVLRDCPKTLTTKDLLVPIRSLRAALEAARQARATADEKGGAR